MFPFASKFQMILGNTPEDFHKSAEGTGYLRCCCFTRHILIVHVNRLSMLQEPSGTFKTTWTNGVEIRHFVIGMQALQEGMDIAILKIIIIIPFTSLHQISIRHFELGW